MPRMALRRRGGGDDEMGDVSVHPNATDGPAPLGLQRPGFGESTTLAPPNSAPSLEDVLEGGACAREGDTWHGGSGGSRSLVGPTDCPADCDLPDYAGAGLAEVPISEITRALQPSVSVGNLSAKGPAARPPPGVQDLRVDRQTACGNPFPMGADGRDERLRDAVCFAFDEFLKDPIGADLDAIAAKYQLRVDGRFRKPAARQGLADALDAAEARLRVGESLRLMCWCFPKRCHADGIAQTLCRRLREAGIEVDVVGRPGSGAHDNATRSGGAAATLEVEAAPSAAAHCREDGGRGCAPGRGGRGQARGRRGVSRLQ